MKKLFFTFVSILSSYFLFAQCTPGVGTGNPSVTPTPENVPCIERGVFYEEYIYTENVSPISVLGGLLTVTVSPTKIDSLGNFPCGIKWETNKSDNSYGPGETGCIRVYGTTLDSVGQYKLQIYMTITLDIPGILTQSFSGELGELTYMLDTFLVNNNLAGLLTIPIPETNYYSRVIEAGTTCPAIDTTSSANNLTASCATSVGIEDQIAENTQSFEVYPNPNTGRFMINVSNPSQEDQTLRIYDLQGKQVYQERITDLNGSKEIKMSQLSKGIYTIHLSSLTTSSVKKVVIY